MALFGLAHVGEDYQEGAKSTAMPNTLERAFCSAPYCPG